MKNFLRPGAFAVAALAFLLPAGFAPAQAVIKVNDDVNVKFGFLLQPQADWLQDGATQGTPRTSSPCASACSSACRSPRT